jgi:maltooligosyltrehalose trehalohydrolase
MNFNTGESTCEVQLPDGGWQKIIDSADSCWEGPGALLPDTLEKVSEFTVPPMSIAIYVKNDKVMTHKPGQKE